MKKYLIIKTTPASLIFQHSECREVLSVHAHYIIAWIKCYLWHNSKYIPCHIVKSEIELAPTTSKE